MANLTGTILRGLYASVATIYSILGLIEFGLYLFALDTTLTSSSAQQFLNAYAVIRLVMAVLQIPAHMGLLFAARYFTSAADWILNRLGGGEKGKDQYYSYITKCNYGLATFIALGVTVLAVTWDYGVVDTHFIVLELISLGLLSLVLISRVIAYLTDNVREWFYLAWSGGVPVTGV